MNRRKRSQHPWCTSESLKLYHSLPVYIDTIEKYNIALKFFYHYIDKFSPIAIKESFDKRHQKYIYDLFLTKSFAPGGETRELLKNSSINDLDIYEDYRKIDKALATANIIGQGVQGTVYTVGILEEGYDPFNAVLKKSAIIEPNIYAKYVLLNEWVKYKTPEVGIMLERELRRVYQDELYYLNKFGQYSESYDIENCKQMDDLRKLYNHICMDQVLNRNSDANIDVIVTWVTAGLVIDKKTPAFPLLYSSFKTNDPMSSDVGIVPAEDLLGSFRYDVTKYIYPHQYMAIEKLDYTLYELLRSSLFDYDIFGFEKIAQRYLDIIAQATLALFTAQKNLSYVSNDAHSKNFMVKKYVGSIYYCIHPDDLPNTRKIFPEGIFTTGPNGYIVLEIKSDTGILKIIDQGRANIVVPGGIVGSRTTNFVAESYGVDNYDPLDFNNDLLRLFLELYDEEFVGILLDRIKNNVASDSEITLIDIYREAFQCREDQRGRIESLFKVRKNNCDQNATCQRIFDYFGAYGYGSGSGICTITDKTTPDNIMKYLGSYNYTGCDVSDLSFCYSIMGSRRFNKSNKV